MSSLYVHAAWNPANPGFPRQLRQIHATWVRHAEEELVLSTPTHLIVLMAFDRDDEGNLHPAFEPREFQSKERAISEARKIARDHAGVIAWAREARPDIGEYGEPEELIRAGEVPDME